MAPYFGLKGAWLTVAVTTACAADMTLFGYDQGVFGGVIVTDDFLNLLDLQGNSSLQGTITAIYDLGCFVGALSTVWLGEPLGRKKTILLGTTIMSIGAILQTLSYGVPQMIVGRIVSGIGNGINTSTAPVWQGETSQASWRGKLVVIELACTVLGFVLSNWVTYGLSYATGPVSWRLPLAFQFLFIFILYATVPWLPESPRWLMAKGRVGEAEKILADVEGVDVNDPYVAAESNDIQWAIQYEAANTFSWGGWLRGRTGQDGGTSTVRRLFLGMGTLAMQQFSGVNVLAYYMPLVLITSVGFDNQMARLLAACSSVSFLLSSLVGIPIVEKWGRRKMMMYCAFAQGLCYAAITICIRYNDADFIGSDLQEKFAKASVAFFFMFYVFFGIGWLGVPWLYPTEINSLSMRTKGAALASATNWIVNFMVVEITPSGIATLGWQFYVIWTVLNFAFVPVVYLFYPETAGRTLEDVDRFFRENQNVLVYKDKEATASTRPTRYIEQERQEVKRNSAHLQASAQGPHGEMFPPTEAERMADDEKAYEEHFDKA